MIVPMKKITVLVLDSRRDRELANIKRLGVLHPVIERRTSEDSQALLAQRDQLLRALSDLPETDEPQHPLPSVPSDVLSRAQELGEEIHAMAEERRGLRESLERLRREKTRLAPWGDFDPVDLLALAEVGISIRLFSMGIRDWKRARPEGSVPVAVDSRTARFAMVWLSGDHIPSATPEELADRPDIEEFIIPETSPAQIAAHITEAEQRLAELGDALLQHAGHRATLTEALGILARRIEHEEVRIGMDAAERVAYITGFVPADAEDRIRRAATNNGWGLLIRDPAPDDEVPTRIVNPRWVRTIRPVFNLLGVIPGYRERDISLWFLLFFTVFVGMIIGDAGYGAILFLASIVAVIRSRRRSGRVGDGVILLAVLSASTLAWGAISGNWFGYEPIAGLRPFSYAVVPQLYSFDPRSTRAVQWVCFLLAAVHLSIARIWNFARELREKPAIKAFAQLGWLSVLLGLYFLVVSLFLGQPMPPYALYLIAGGMGAVFLFSGQSPDRGFFGGVGRGLSSAFTIVFQGIGAFSDIISYIRLFAVGLASVAIAQAFNEMASSVGSGPVGIALAVVILLFGHTLNLIMGALAVVVHGVRLNLLEFSGHLGMEWTGVAYRPFAENEEQSEGVSL